MSKTRIDWCDEVWNPVTGCTPVGDGCRYCYAKRMFSRLAASVLVSGCKEVNNG